MKLPVTGMRDDRESADPPLDGELSRILRGAVRFRRHERMLFSTDASIYQIEPLGVVHPVDDADVRALARFCQDRRIALLPRGGATSLAGQCTNRAIVCDLSPTFRQILSFDAERRLLHAQVGLSIDEINRYLCGLNANLFFAPDPATSAQAALGGVIGNNAAGARSLRYGRTSENLAGVQVVLVSGEQTWLESGAGRRCAIARSLSRQIARIVRDVAGQIHWEFPPLKRRNAGYNLDLILRQIDAGIADDDLDLSGLICGSEGTLAIVTSARLKLHPIPIAKGLAILSFADLVHAIDSVAAILETNPVAVELIDEPVLTAAAGNNQCRKYLQLLAPVNGQRPSAVLYVEYQDESPDAGAIEQGFVKLRAMFAQQPARYFTDADSMAMAWALRKAGEPLLHGMSAHRKPCGFVEDNAIPVENLSRFVRQFKRIVSAHGTTASYYAHASVGVLHVRPMIDLHVESDRAIMRSIATQVAQLTRECGGVVSGEHGDGRVRGPFLASHFSPQILDALARIKRAFDPNGILNPGIIVNAGPVDGITQSLRVKPHERPIEIAPVETYFDYSDQEGFQGAVEMCNGAGVCRKTAGGSMCPSYRGTLDERHSTRGRGNALRLAISGQLRRDDWGKPDFTDDEALATLDLCLSCKACKSECPSNVDIARLKAEYLAQRYKSTGVPLAARVFGHVRKLNQIGAAIPELANWINVQPWIRLLLNQVLRLAPQRSMPSFSRSLYRLFDQRLAGHRREKVVLYGDCFTSYNESHIGIAAIELLEALGYEVLLPKVVCCGRAMISTGLLDDAIASIDASIVRLARYVDDPNVKAIVVVEPSCLSAIKDDWLLLKVRAPLELRKKLADKSFLIEQFIDYRWDEHPNRAKLPTSPRGDGPPVILHGHCHQKSLWGDESSAAAIRRFVGSRLKVLDSGCCGMAGSFGYIDRRYELSMRIGELSVFPPVRSAPPDAIILAPGTSCRHQIHDGAHHRAIHPVEFLAAQIAACGAPT